MFSRADIMVRRSYLMLGRFLSLRDRVPAVPLPLPLPLPLPAALDARLLPLHVVAELQREGGAGVAGCSGGDAAGAAAAPGGVGEGRGALPGLRRRRGRTGGADEEAPATPSPLAAAPPAPPPAGLPFFPAAPSVEFQSVVFSYRADGGAPALRGATFTVPGGCFAAFVGRSGSGKSTCARLLQRFADPASGRVLVGGVDVRELPLQQLRGRAVAGMDQESALLQRTLSENIALGWEPPPAPVAPLGEVHPAVRAAAEEAQAADFISARAGGFNGGVGERGGALSGGERQRVALARLLLRAPQLAVVDEGTSALDAVSEAAVLRALMGSIGGGGGSGAPRVRTTILIAHRLATVAHADLVFVFQQGTVVEWGPPAELEGRGGAYAELLRASRCEAPT
jgi:ABC-type multidrug transport system fused ATPase/permease subunit